ncbi:tyrosine-type recombinase/integrase [Streptomyces uncialis]|uniref:tyrosine-type recombinase/integrase n=1 Tax=Streptomyces uncialis TaxID=1048205 RepID=UPI0022524C63|nr:site-specific integrase [Streptomyces uncialis]MCX4664709.1 site-specific integrase [Streptomyces uncialis]
MAGHIQDRWYKTTTGPDHKPVKERSDRYGTGLRYRARYIGPDGTEKSKSFRDGQKRLAEKWLSKTETDMATGQYVDPRSARTTFQEHAVKWVAAQTSDIATRQAVEMRLRLHAYPHIGSRPLGSFRPEHIRAWVRVLEDTVPAASYRRAIFGNVSAVLTAAVDDGLLLKNPCRAESVKAPKPSPTRVKPWPAEWVFGVREALPGRYRAGVDLGGGCGLRQGEVFGLPVDEVDFLGGWLHVAYQIKLVRGKPVFAPPKGGKERDVPFPSEVGAALAAHMTVYPPVAITLPWCEPDGAPVTKKLFFTNSDGHAVRRNAFNLRAWKPALAAVGVIPVPERGERHAKAPEHGMHALRHFYASVLLDAGENIKALSQYLGHSDPGFTLRTYTHLMPSSEGRTRKAVNQVYGEHGSRDHGSGTAQAA